MNPLNNIISITTKIGTICFELESSINVEPADSIETKIKHYDNFLEKLAIPRTKINEIKKIKDQLVKKYIFSTKAPKTLDVQLLNYKALLFYFKDSFIKKQLLLKLDSYNNDKSMLKSSKQNSFEKYFIDEKINIKVDFDNFPHLIGIKKPLKNFNYIDEFLDDIFYETKLLEDYKDHKGDIHKIKTFSWIFATLQNPIYIFDKDAIKKNKTNFESDLTFVRKIKGNFEYKWHVLGLRERENRINYVINSQFPVKTDNEFYQKFDMKKKIYSRKNHRKEYKRRP